MEITPFFVFFSNFTSPFCHCEVQYKIGWCRITQQLQINFNSEQHCSKLWPFWNRQKKNKTQNIKARAGEVEVCDQSKCCNFFFSCKSINGINVQLLLADKVCIFLLFCRAQNHTGDFFTMSSGQRLLHYGATQNVALLLCFSWRKSACFSLLIPGVINCSTARLSGLIHWLHTFIH